MAKPAETKALNLGTVATALLALLFGFTAWLVVRQRDNTQILLRIGIQPANIDETMEVKLEPSELPVLFTYPKSAEGYLRPQYYGIELDLEAAVRRLTPGQDVTDTERISVEDVKASEPVPLTVVAAMLPQGNRITWTLRLRTAEVPVEPDITGTPEEGFVWRRENLYLEPKTVQVALTAALEEKMRAGLPLPALRTEPIDITGKSQLSIEDVELVYPLGEGMRPVPNSPISRVVVTIPFEETVTQRLVTGVPVRYVPLLANRVANVEPNLIEVQVSGPRSVVERLAPTDIIVSLREVEEEIEQPQEVEILVTIPESKRSGKVLTITHETKKVLVRIANNGAGAAGGATSAGDEEAEAERAVDPLPLPTPFPAVTPSPTPMPTPVRTPAVATPMPTPSPSPTATPTPPPAVKEADSDSTDTLSIVEEDEA